jgi:signal transduction histidine kinase/CheY-like chemotaxis protein
MIPSPYRRIVNATPWRWLANKLVRTTRIKALITRSMMSTTALLTGAVLFTQIYSLHEGLKEEGFRTGERVVQALSEKLLVPITTGDHDEALRVLKTALRDSAVARLALTIDPVGANGSPTELEVKTDSVHESWSLRFASSLCSACVDTLEHKTYRFDIKTDEYPSASDSKSTKGSHLGSVLVTLDLSSIVAPRLDQIAIIMLVVSLLALFSFSLANAIRDHISNPLDKLLRAMHRMKMELGKPEGEIKIRLKDGDFPTSRQRDINDLMDAFKKLTLSHYDQEDAMNAELQSREQTIAAATQELTLLLEKANEANQIKDNFINLMSHELRQPLYASKMSAMNIVRDPNLNSFPSIKRNIDLIIREMAKASHQIDNVLEFSKNKRDPKVPAIASFDLFRKIESAVTSASGMAYSKDLYIDFIVEGEVPNQIDSCPDSWGHVIDNYIGNAIKYTNEGGVRVYLGQTNETTKDVTWLRFAVEDTGIGVPTEKQDYIFEPFSQVEDARTRSHNGFGLGLAIVSEHVAALGGRRGVEQLEDGGTRFWVEIPVARSRANSSEQSSGQQKLKKINAQFVIMDPRQSFRCSVKTRLQNFDGICHEAGDINTLEALLPSLTDQQRILIVRRVASKEFRQFAGLNLQDLKKKGFDFVISLEPTLESDAVEGVYTRGEADFGFVESIEMINFIGQLYEKQNSTGKEDHDMYHFIELLRMSEKETLKNVKILLVDDHQTNLDVMSQSLEGYGAEVVCALGGQKAIDCANDEEFDVILMDIMMPKIDGIHATRHIRSESLNTETLVFALSAAALDPTTQQEMRHLRMELMSKMTAGENLVFGIKSRLAGMPPKPQMHLVKSGVA